jgi:restriction endonuclease Mrr
MIGAAAFMVAGFVFFYSLGGDLVGLMGAITGLATGLIVFGLLLYFPSTPYVERRVEEIEENLRQTDEALIALGSQQLHVQQRLTEVGFQYSKLREELQRVELVRSVANLREQLYLRNWRAMRSVEFEEFLREVFEAHGDTVETTRVSGDQGVDLIVRRRGRRLAVQVKGYFNSVGNGAVQEAYAGMGYYGCDGCAVITNSRFTKSAVDLATKLGCILIDEDTMQDFIMGKINF